jgi:hypothetical protein
MTADCSYASYLAASIEGKLDLYIAVEITSGTAGLFEICLTNDPLL